MNTYAQSSWWDFMYSYDTRTCLYCRRFGAHLRQVTVIISMICKFSDVNVFCEFPHVSGVQLKTRRMCWFVLTAAVCSVCRLLWLLRLLISVWELDWETPSKKGLLVEITSQWGSFTASASKNVTPANICTVHKQETVFRLLTWSERAGQSNMDEANTLAVCLHQFYVSLCAGELTAPEPRCSPVDSQVSNIWTW